MQSSGIATCRKAIARIFTITSLLIISVLATLPEVSHAQPCSSCNDISIYDTGYSFCTCTDSSCTGGLCDNFSHWTIVLSASATCCIDSIAVTPPPGVCWQGCMSIATMPLATTWGYTSPNPHISCAPGYGSFFGTLPFGYLLRESGPGAKF